MKRIRTAKVLLSGLQGLGAEVAKNLVLMGVGSLTLHDPHPTCWDDLAAQVRLMGIDGFDNKVELGAPEETPGSKPPLFLVFPLRARFAAEQG